MTIGEQLVKSMWAIRLKRQRPRRAVVAWMKRNNYWYGELIAQEWEKQTGEEWQKIYASAYVTSTMPHP